MASFDDDMRENVRTLETGFGTGGAREEFTWMIGELTGGDSGLMASTPNEVSGDIELSPRSKVVQNQSADDALMFSSNETSDRTAAEAEFDLTIYDYENLGNDWTVPNADGAVSTPQRVDFGDWGASEKI